MNPLPFLYECQLDEEYECVEDGFDFSQSQAAQMQQQDVHYVVSPPLESQYNQSELFTTPPETTGDISDIDQIPGEQMVSQTVVDLYNEVDSQENVHNREEGKVYVEEFFDPVVPGARDQEIVGEVSGWNKIDSLDAWDCFLSCFDPLDDVPSQHIATWVECWDIILTEINEAERDSLDMEKDLKWFLLLPQALIRRPRRGGEAGRIAVAQQFNALINEDWGLDLDLFLRDKQLTEEELGKFNHSNKAKNQDGISDKL